MKPILSTAWRGLALMLMYALLITQVAQAQYTTATAGAQDPEEEAQRLLLKARTVFVTLDGSDSHFPRTPMSSEDAFTQSLLQWGRYKQAPDVQHADVVLRLHPAVHVSVIDSTDDTGSSIYYTPYFRLTIAEPGTLKPIWNITVPVRTGRRRADHADLFVLSAQNLASQLKLLVGEELSAEEVANMTEVERTPHSKLRVVLPVVLVGATVAGGVVKKMKYDSSVQKQKDDLCKQNAFFCNSAVSGTAH